MPRIQPIPVTPVVPSVPDPVTNPDGYNYPHKQKHLRTITGVLGNPTSTLPLGAAQDGYVLTWSYEDGYYLAQPLPNQDIESPNFTCAYFAQEYFTTNSTWTCPDGVTNVLVIAAGGGQGGGGASNTANGLGGCGALQNTAYMPTVPGTTYNIIIGAGGIGAIGSASIVSPPTNGLSTMIKNGTNTLFSTIGAMVMTGLSFIGSVGGNTNGLNGSPGSINSLNTYQGGVGGIGTASNNTNAYGGGGGGAGPQGNGASGGNAAYGGNGLNGNDAMPNTGAGGGGGGSSATGVGGNGGQGGSGYLYLIY